jgi:hypothetical protein
VFVSEGTKEVVSLLLQLGRLQRWSKEHELLNPTKSKSRARALDVREAAKVFFDLLPFQGGQHLGLALGPNLCGLPLDLELRKSNKKS